MQILHLHKIYVSKRCIQLVKLWVLC